MLPAPGFSRFHEVPAGIPAQYKSGISTNPLGLRPKTKCRVFHLSKRLGHGVDKS
ncbi:hypothetical protein HMPREF9278_1236 [Mobiluncus mulieris FB024-16]|nr:hypothetical protein HMPREF9278_1236 [Mobiluncus mulieris FB024-16]